MVVYYHAWTVNKKINPTSSNLDSFKWITRKPFCPFPNVHSGFAWALFFDGVGERLHSICRWCACCYTPPFLSVSLSFNIQFLPWEKVRIQQSHSYSTPPKIMLLLLSSRLLPAHPPLLYRFIIKAADKVDENFLLYTTSLRERGRESEREREWEWKRKISFPYLHPSLWQESSPSEIFQSFWVEVFRGKQRASDKVSLLFIFLHSQTAATTTTTATT